MFKHHTGTLRNMITYIVDYIHVIVPGQYIHCIHYTHMLHTLHALQFMYVNILHASTSININCLYTCMYIHYMHIQYLGGITGPLTVESEGLQGSLHKNEQLSISLLVGGGYTQTIPLLFSHVHAIRILMFQVIELSVRMAICRLQRSLLLLLLQPQKTALLAFLKKGMTGDDL